MLQHALGVGLVELGALYHGMAQHQPAVAGKIDVDDFDVGVDEADIVLPRQFAPQPAIATLVVDRVDQDTGPFLRIVMQMEHAEVPHQPRAHELADEALIAIIGPDVA